ncbi:MAG: replicative DNA helicase [Planctomycetota bacterium]
MSTTGKPKDSKRAGDAAPGADRRQLSRLFEALPPHATEAEMSLLGSIFIEPHAVGDVMTVVRGGDDFFKPVHGLIFDAMVELYDQRGTLDIVQLNQLLVDRDLLKDVGGVAYLVDLASAVPTAANAMHYARAVRDKAIVRDVISAAGDVLADAYENPEDANQLVDRAQAKMFAVASDSISGESVGLAALLNEAMREIEAKDDGQMSGVPTGYAELDELTHGLQPGEMIILAARPSMGKTALALNIAENMAMRGHPIAFFSMEMGREQLVYRLLAARSGVDLQRLRRGMLRPDDFRALTMACGELVDAPILIDDTPGLSVMQLRVRARRMKVNNDLKAIFVDYLQLMTSGTRVESRQIEVAEISRGIKALARELEVPVICLSQLNRAAEQREGHRPRMSDLRESGAIEQDADVVSMLHREEYYHRNDPEWIEHNPDKKGYAELILAKQRNGPTGVVKLTWDSFATSFRDFAEPGTPREYVETKPYAADGAATTGSAFAGRPTTGPVGDFRDGGGPDKDDVGGIPI